MAPAPGWRRVQTEAMDAPCPDQCGECCTYMSFAAPSTDADYLEWLTFHGCTLTYRRGAWHVRVPIACRHVQANGACGIHDDRPQMCREYECEKWMDYSELIDYFIASKMPGA